MSNPAVTSLVVAAVEDFSDQNFVFGPLLPESQKEFKGSRSFIAFCPYIMAETSK